MTISRGVGFAVSATLLGFILSTAPAFAQSLGATRGLPPAAAPLIHVQLRAAKPLTAQQLRDLESKPDQWNMNARLPPPMTQALGVTSGSQVLTVRQLGRKTSAGYALALNLIPNSTDIILIARRPNGPLNLFLLAGDFSVKKTAQLQDRKPATEIPAAEAQELLDGILSFYAQIAATFAAAK